MARHFPFTDPFASRHIGPDPQEVETMLDTLGVDDIDELIEKSIPKDIRLKGGLDLPQALSEFELLNRLQDIAARNSVKKSYIGMGYHDTITPPALQRNILENPGWYTQYTPYQAEISQGRLEALLNFQTTVIDLTGLPVANASLLDEPTAAAEAMMMLQRVSEREDRNVFFVSARCHPQTIAVLKTRAVPVGIEVVVGDHESFEFNDRTIGVLVQYPTSDGEVLDYAYFCERAHSAGAYVVVAADLLSLTLLESPGGFDADVAVGNTQRFGVPLGYGGPHAAYFATRDELKRQVPGRIIGVSVDRQGDQALRMALQTREQHIRRERATSNICTAQVLLAIIAGAYAVYHGPEGLKRIASRVHGLTKALHDGLQRLGHQILFEDYFDTLRVKPVGLGIDEIQLKAKGENMNLRYFDDGTAGISLDETVDEADLNILLSLFATDAGRSPAVSELDQREGWCEYTGSVPRSSKYLEHPVFNRYHSETEMMRYLHRLQSRDLSLTTSMIPLGSCTMKLNAAAELLPITWRKFNRIHPFAPVEQAEGYRVIIDELESWLGEITGFPAVSLQPNSGAQGEYAGLLVIRSYHRSRGDTEREICLIPSSAHGTNPASAVMVGMQVVVVKCDQNGNIDLEDLRTKAEANRDRLSALMVTYPSTHGVFEQDIREICEIVHDNGGQVYMDGANMNAQVGLCRPGDFGVDVCHLNLHKTFSIPHGGGGPGMGPICAAAHLAAFMPNHPIVNVGGKDAVGPVSAAPWGSANILLISWAYIAMMGGTGLTEATKVAILNANYMAKRLDGHYNVLFRGKNGTVAHEFILDLRPFRKSTGVTEEDVAKRLMDYGFHAPTMSWPVPGTMMIEPTESESKEELDRFCEAMISIRAEIQEIELGMAHPSDNVLKHAPHTATVVTSDAWPHAYSRRKAAFPADWLSLHKFWPAVSRVDNAYGDRNLICACPPMEEYA